MKSTRSIKSHLTKRGTQSRGIRKKRGSVQCLTLKSCNLRLSESLTGSQAKFIQTMTTKKSFTLSHLSPSTLLCTPCGRSTYTLTLVKIAKKSFIEIRCTTCGNAGLIGWQNLKDLTRKSPLSSTRSSQIRAIIVRGAHSQKAKVAPVVSDIPPLAERCNWNWIKYSERLGLGSHECSKCGEISVLLTQKLVTRKCPSKN